MIKKSIIIGFILLAVWTLFLFRFKQVTSSGNQWQDNVVKAQKYIYSDSPHENVIVGTSLSCRLRSDSIKDYYNLAFGGMSLYDGLYIIQKSEHLPKTIFIEANLINYGPDNNFDEKLFEPFPYYLKKYVVSFRDDKQPVTWLTSIAISKEMKAYTEYRRKSEFKTEVTDSSKKIEVDPVALHRQYGIDSNLDLYAKAVDCDASLTRLGEYLKYFASKHVNVVFFEMPINNQLVNLKRPTMIREELRKRYPNYYYINLPPDYMNYVSSDGLHLSWNEATVYTSYLKNEFVKYANSQKTLQ